MNRFTLMFNQLKTLILLGILTGILLAVGGLFGGQLGMLIALGLAAAMNLGAYFFSDKIVLRLYRAKLADEREYKFLHDIVEDLAKRANIPKPKIYIIPDESANAFATGRNPEHAVVACTEGILKIMTKEELKGVLAHEISHVSNRDILIMSIVATIAGAISFVAYIARFGAIFGGARDENSGNAMHLLIMAILTPFIAMLIQLAISRNREYQADASGAKLLGDGKPLASALRKLHAHSKRNFIPFATESTAHLFITNPLKPSMLLSFFQTHPPMESRVEKLESMKFE